MNILLIGGGVIGTVYGAHLALAGHSVSVLARHGNNGEGNAGRLLRATDITTGKTVSKNVAVVTDVSVSHYDFVLVSVRMEQIESTFSDLAKLSGVPTVLFFGNNTNGRSLFPESLAIVVELGFPGIGGFMSNGVASYVQIPQQPAVIETKAGLKTKKFEFSLRAQGFKFSEVDNMEGWLLYHAVFIAVVCGALSRRDNESDKFAGDRPLVKLMCKSITEGFAALRRKNVKGGPLNLMLLHFPLLRFIAIAYWRRFFRSSLGENVFAQHARHAPVEVRAMSDSVLEILFDDRKTETLKHLLESGR